MHHLLCGISPQQSQTIDLGGANFLIFALTLLLYLAQILHISCHPSLSGWYSDNGFTRSHDLHFLLGIAVSLQLPSSNGRGNAVLLFFE
jgi:hypothetical protein